MVVARHVRAGAFGPTVNKNVAPAIGVIDFMLALAGRPVVAERPAAGIAGAIAPVNIPGLRRGRRLVPGPVGADIEPGAPMRDAVIGEHVADDVERVAEQIDRPAMGAVRLRARIAIDQIVLNGDIVLIHGVVEKNRPAASAGIVAEDVPFDDARDVGERDAGADQRLIGADIVVDEVVGDLEALRFVEVANYRLRVAADLETVDRGQLLSARRRVFDAQE